MFILTSKSSPLQSLSLPCLKSSRFTVYKKRRLWMLVVFLILCTYTARSANCCVNIPNNNTNSVPGKNIPWKTLTRVISFISKPGAQILFKRIDECFGCITVSCPLVVELVYSFYKSGTYLTFVSNKKNKFVLNPIEELKISFSHP